MNRRDFLSLTVLGLASRGYPSSHQETDEKDAPQKNYEGPVIESNVTTIDKKILQDFLLEFDNDKTPDYTLEDVERNMLLIGRYLKDGSLSTCNGILINEKGYFLSVSHFLCENSFRRKTENFHILTASGGKYGIERIVILSPGAFFDGYDFLIGKINNKDDLPITPMVYSTNRYDEQEIIRIPSTRHPKHKRIKGKVVERDSNRYFPPNNFNFITSPISEEGYSGSMIVTSNMKIIGLNQGIYRLSYSRELKVEYLENAIRSVL